MEFTGVETRAHREEREWLYLATMEPSTWRDNLCEQRELTFRTSPRLSVIGRWLVVLSLAAATLMSYAGVSGAEWRLTVSACVAAFVAGAAMALWIRAAELRFDEGVLIHRRGFWPFAGIQRESLSAYSAVELVATERTDEPGYPRLFYGLHLRGTSGCMVLLVEREDDRVEALAAALADRLQMPLWTETRIEVKRPAPVAVGRLITGSMWLAMIVVGGIMLAPVLSGSKPLFATQVRQPAQDDYRAGLADFWSGRYPEAEATLGRAAKQNPRNAEILNMLAYAQAEQRKLDDALATARKAVALAPNDPMIIDTLGEMHERHGNLVLAAQYYEDALRRFNPVDACETNTKLARTLIALHRRADAVKHLEAALQYPSGQWDGLARNLLKSVAPGHAVPPLNRAPRRGFGPVPAF